MEEKLEEMLNEIKTQNRQISTTLSMVLSAVNSVDVKQPSAAPSVTSTASKPKQTVPLVPADFLLAFGSFKDFSSEDAAVLASVCAEKIVEANEVIYKSGDLGESLFIIKEGQVKIFRKDEKGEFEIAKLEAGKIFGEMALVENKPRSVSVKAVSRVTLLEMGKEKYASLFRDHSEVGAKFVNMLLTTLAERLRETDRRMLKFYTSF